MREKVTALVLLVVLGFYSATIGWRGVELVRDGRPVPVLLGLAVILIPVAGELIWAPISAFLFWRMFGFRKGFLGGVFSFVEELIPGLDFIPTFTISWLLLYFKRNKEALSFRPFIR